jgi:hypothetical protein
MGINDVIEKTEIDLEHEGASPRVVPPEITDDYAPSTRRPHSTLKFSKNRENPSALMSMNPSRKEARYGFAYFMKERRVVESDASSPRMSMSQSARVGVR